MNTMEKIYCAGPLFNPKEKQEMEEIASVLENNNFRVFLPHRDGFEFSNLTETFKEIGIPDSDANYFLQKAIFTLDVYQVLDSDGLILNINGRVPDEGAMVEAGIAWNAGKRVVIYKNDSRTLLHGNDNPLLLGLSNFRVINDIQSIAKVFKDAFRGGESHMKTKIDSSNLIEFYDKGEKISFLAKNGNDKKEICLSLISILGK